MGFKRGTNAIVASGCLDTEKGSSVVRKWGEKKGGDVLRFTKAIGYFFDCYDDEPLIRINTRHMCIP